MTMEFCYVMVVVAISRLPLLLKDGAVSRTDRGILRTMLAVQLVGVAAFGVDGTLAIYPVVAALSVAFWWIEARGKSPDGVRSLAFIAHAIILSALFSRGFGVSFSHRVVGWMIDAKPYSLLLDLAGRVDPSSAAAVLMGFLVATNEANFVIRHLFRALHLAPMATDLKTTRRSRKAPVGKHTDPPAEPVENADEGAAPAAQEGVRVLDKKVYNAGRIIGILERGLVYSFVLNGQYAVIAFVLTAKSIARFKQLDEREFAEYMLIGTLLSALLAVLVAEAVRSLLG